MHVLKPTRPIPQHQDVSCECGAELRIELKDLFKGSLPEEPSNVLALWECPACHQQYPTSVPADVLVTLPMRSARVKRELWQG
jgi:hypothetical protein